MLKIKIVFANSSTTTINYSVSSYSKHSLSLHDDHCHKSQRPYNLSLKTWFVLYCGKSKTKKKQSQKKKKREGKGKKTKVNKGKREGERERER